MGFVNIGTIMVFGSTLKKKDVLSFYKGVCFLS